MIYRRSHIETTKKVETSTHMQWLSIQRDISAVKISPEKLGVLTLCHDPQPRTPEPGRETCMASGGENQQGFSLPGRDGSLLETQIPSSQDQALLFLEHQLGECTSPALQLLETPTLLSLSPAERSTHYTQQGPLMPSFSGEEVLGKDSNSH